LLIKIAKWRCGFVAPFFVAKRKQPANGGLFVRPEE
jgi:hypothetical protein